MCNNKNKNSGRVSCSACNAFIKYAMCIFQYAVVYFSVCHVYFSVFETVKRPDSTVYTVETKSWKTDTGLRLCHTENDTLSCVPLGSDGSGQLPMTSDCMLFIGNTNISACPYQGNFHVYSLKIFCPEEDPCTLDHLSYNINRH